MLISRHEEVLNKTIESSVEETMLCMIFQFLYFSINSKIYKFINSQMTITLYIKLGDNADYVSRQTETYQQVRPMQCNE